MRVLFICQFFTPDITAAAFRMADFARILAEKGDEVRVITTYPHKACVDEVDDGPFLEAGVRIDRCRVPKVEGTGAKPYLRHYMAFVRGSLRLGWRIWREGWSPDVIYASSPPLFIGISGRILSLLFRRPMVFEVRDIWPDAAVSAGQLTAGGFAYRWGQRLERYLYRKADHITCVAQPMRDYLLEFARGPVTVVYNGIALDAIGSCPCPDETTETSSTPTESRRTILYAGNLGHVQQLDLLILAMSELVNSPAMNGWQLELLGAGAQLDNLRRLAEARGVADRVNFLPAVSRNEAAERMRNADVLYLHLMQDETMERTIPSKLFDYLAAARPIVAGLAGEGRDVLESTGANLVFEPGNLAQMRTTILEAVTNWTLLCESACKNRDLVEQRFTRRAAADVLRQVFHAVCDRKHS